MILHTKHTKIGAQARYIYIHVLVLAVGDLPCSQVRVVVCPRYASTLDIDVRPTQRAGSGVLKLYCYHRVVGVKKKCAYCTHAHCMFCIMHGSQTYVSTCNHI